MIGLKEIQSAQRKILPYINKTPLIKSNYLSKNESNIFLKLESMQITGSFKFRGALNKLLNLSIVKTSLHRFAKMAVCQPVPVPISKILSVFFNFKDSIIYATT